MSGVIGFDTVSCGGAAGIIEVNADEDAFGLVVPDARAFRQRNVAVVGAGEHGDETPLLEKALDPPSHVERQIFFHHPGLHAAGILSAVARVNYDNSERA